MRLKASVYYTKCSEGTYTSNTAQFGVLVLRLWPDWLQPPHLMF